MCELSPPASLSLKPRWFLKMAANRKLTLAMLLTALRYPLWPQVLLDLATGFGRLARSKNLDRENRLYIDYFTPI